MYQRTWQLFDDLHKEAPDLFIDCTFETMGAQQLIDLDMCKHAEGNWLSNFGEKAPLGLYEGQADVVVENTCYTGNCNGNWQPAI